MRGLVRSKDVRAFALVVLLAFAVRFVYLLEARACPLFDGLIVDGISYGEWSDRIVAGDWLGDRVFYQAPLYPYFLALVKLAVGRELWDVRLVQIALGALACGLVFLAGARFFGRASGIAAGALLAFYPSAVFFDGCIQKAGIGLVWTALLLAVLASVRAEPHARASAWRWLGVGVALGLLMLTREETLLLVPVLAGWLVLEHRASSWSLRTRWLASFAAGLALVLVPVASRNAYVGGEFLLSTSQAGSNFYIGNGPNADGTYVPLRPGRHNTQFEREDAFEMAKAEAGRDLSPSEVSRFWFSKSFASIAADPSRWLALLARKARLLASAYELPDAEDLYFYLRYTPLLAGVERVWNYGVLLPLAAAGAVLTWRRKREIGVLFVLGTTLALGVVAFYVFARYRYPLVPVFVLFAGAALVEGWSAARSKELRRLALAGLVFSVAWLASNLAPPYARDQMLADSLGNAGVVQAQAGDAERAVELLREAVALKPQSPELHGNLGLALLDARRADEAVDAFVASRSLRPADAFRAQLRVGWALSLAGRHNQALDEIERALAMSPSNAEALGYASDALRKLGRWREARERLEAVVARHPKEREPRRRLAWMLACAPDDATRDGARALTFARALRDEARDKDPDAVELFAAALAELGRFDEAAQLQRSLVAALRTSPLAASARAKLESYERRAAWRLAR